MGVKTPKYFFFINLSSEGRNYKQTTRSFAAHCRGIQQRRNRQKARKQQENY